MNEGVPRRTLALIGANGLSAAAQGQFMFVVPWMLLARGHSPRDAALATGFMYVPLLLFAIPAGLISDRIDPRRVLAVALVLALAASALYPLAAIGGADWFALVLGASAVVGITRNYAEGAIMRGIADTTAGGVLLRAHAVRTTVNQVALFGAPFVGLLFFRLGGASAVMIGICALHAVALVGTLALPPLGRRPTTEGDRPPSLAAGLAALRASAALRAVMRTNVLWNVCSGAALGLMPAVLREHLGMDELHASATLVAGGIAVALGTIPAVILSHRRSGPAAPFLVAGAAQAAATLLLADARLALIAPLAYVVFQLSNSTAAATLNGLRALVSAHEHQAFLSLVVIAAGLIGFLGGLVGAALLVERFGFTVTLVCIGVGFAAVAPALRRPIVPASIPA